MNVEERVAAIAAELRRLGLPCLVMGGHAVRFYGIDRSTMDYDFCLALESGLWDALPATLARSPVIAGPTFREGPSWRPASFRRFVIGTLSDGREERLEFWRSNHLLAPFEELLARRSVGTYGGAEVAFLGLDDLIRSKETEREDDWRDVGLLEEIADERRLGACVDSAQQIAALASLRSRRGFDRALAAGLAADPAVVEAAFLAARSPITRAYLAPSRTAAVVGSVLAGTDAADRLVAGPLRRVTPGSARHLALVEAVRRLYRQAAVAADRADKEKESKL